MKKRILSLALALVMCLGLAVSAMAAYEVKSDKCTYELSNDPIGTTEVSCNDWNSEQSVWEETLRTVYIVPDGTTVVSKTVPNGKILYDMFVFSYLEWYPDMGTERGEPLTITPSSDVADNSFVLYRVYSEDMELPEYSGSLPCDTGICVIAESAVAEYVAKTSASVTYYDGSTTPATPTAPNVPAVPTTGFTDVTADAYYAAPVTWAVEKGITKGTDDVAKKFSPGQNCTNAQILTFLWRAYGQPEPTIGNPFTNTIFATQKS